MAKPQQTVSLRHGDRPKDFVATFRRHTSGITRAKRASRRRWTWGVSALAAIALPAFATPDAWSDPWDSQWQRFTIADAAEAKNTAKMMPFEQAGASFPGSAFYYLEEETWPIQVGEGIRSDADDVPSGPTLGTGPVARAIRIDNSGVDRSRAEQCLTAAVYYEAASEADAGQRAVAQVVLNRVAHPAYPSTVCGVVYEGSERNTGCQFSFTCDGSLARRPMLLFWERARSVARAALAGYVYAPVGLATHYHTVQVHPYWAPSLNYLGTIGAHRFYAFRGNAGNPATFRFAYLGGEPIAAPHRRDNSPSAAAAAAALDPLAVQRAFEGFAPVNANGAVGTAPSALTPAGTTGDSSSHTPPAPPPIYAAEIEAQGGEELYRAKNLPSSGAVKESYVNSGRWIATP